MCLNLLWKTLIPFAPGSREIQLEIMILECRCVLPFHLLPEGWITWWERGISDAKMGFGSTMQSPANCVCFSQNLLSSSLLCVVCQRLLKGKLRSSNAQKLKLAEAKVESCHSQGTLGAGVQDVADPPAQPPVATARAPVKAHSGDSSVLTAHKDRKAT